VISLVSPFWIIKHNLLVQGVENGLIKTEITLISFWFLLDYNLVFIVIIVVIITQKIVIHLFNLILNIGKIMLITDTGLFDILLIPVDKAKSRLWPLEEIIAIDIHHQNHICLRILQRFFLSLF